MTHIDVHMKARELADADGRSYASLCLADREAYAAKAREALLRDAPTQTYVVVYGIPERPGYAGGSLRVTLHEGLTDFEDIRVLIALKRGVRPEQIKVSSLALLAN